jgi:zinc protease
MINPKNIATYAVLAGIASLFYIKSALAGVVVEHWTQINGAQVFLAQSHAIPMVDVQLDLDAGGRRDPVDQAGLASVTARMSGMGILANPERAEPALDENAMGEAWADLGASFVGHASNDRMSFALRSLTYPDLLAKAVQLAARQLAEPAFPADIWRRERETLNASIKEANTRPATLAERAFGQAVYGRHPYGYEVTETTLGRISISDMAALYDKMVRPCRAKVTIVGAVSRVQADALVTQLLSRLPTTPGLNREPGTLPQAGTESAASVATAHCPELPAVSEVSPLLQPSEQRIAFGSAQAHVLIGQPGYKRDDPDFFPMMVGNYILGGGGFVSRLTTEVREKRGLSYSVYSYFSPGLHAGAFCIGLQTRPDQAEHALQVSLDVLTKFVSNGPTAEELKAAKDNLIGGFALRLDSNRKLLDNVANIAWNNLPLNYLDTWTQQVGKVSVSEVNDAFARKLQPTKLATVVLGGSSATGLR